MALMPRSQDFTFGEGQQPFRQIKQKFAPLQKNSNHHRIIIGSTRILTEITYMKMKRFNHLAMSILVGLLLTTALSAQTEERPSKVNKIGNTLVAYYAKSNLSRVMARVRTVFDS